MVNHVVSCAFCGRRHVINDEDPEIWSVVCPCGAHGFAENEGELDIDENEEKGGIPREFSTTYGKSVLLFDTAPVFIDELYRKWYICWRRLK
jgi:hypothetical protein